MQVFLKIRNIFKDSLTIKSKFPKLFLSASTRSRSMLNSYKSKSINLRSSRLQIFFKIGVY